jgi:hypothetical protein
MSQDRTQSPTEIAEGLPPPLQDHYKPAISDSEPSAMQVFFAWEKLRLIISAVLVAWFIYLVFPLREGSDRPDWGRYLAILIFFNICLCVGQVGEGYLYWVGISRSVLAEDICRQYPYLSLVQVHAALTYYYDHEQEMEQDIDRRRRPVADIKAKRADGAL